LKNEKNEILLRHVGHAGPVVDLDWHPELDFTIISSSDDSDVHFKTNSL